MKLISFKVNTDSVTNMNHQKSKTSRNMCQVS